MSHCAAQALETVGGTTKEGAEKQASVLIGTTLDGVYRITRLIAEGGMSAVYEAVQLRLNQRVAVKVMARELASNAEALARFRREAEVTSRLRHPHLVTVMDFGTASGGQPYLVMEHLEGIDLDQRIHQLGRLPLPMVVNITKQVASALAVAHDQGIVHRDLKPPNVFLVELPGEPYFVKILDFGISKVRAATTQLTKTSAIIGTPNYMSPEQATGMLDEVDHRTDQWAVACIVWEMLSGRPPFSSDDISAVFYQVIHLDPQPLRNRVPDLPPGVDTVLRRALSKKATDRFPSVGDFAKALARAASERPYEAVPAGRVAPGRSETSARTSGAAWAERRQSRQERRRLNAQPSLTRSTGTDEIAAAPGVAIWRRVKPIHAISALLLSLGFSLIFALLAPPRWNPSSNASSSNASSKAAALPVAVGANVATSAKPGPSAVTPALLPRPSAPEAPAPLLPESESKKASFDDTTAPHRGPVRSHPRPPRATKTDSNFVDPFGP